MNNYLRKDDTIIALSTPSGTGAVAMIRISGKDAFAISNLFFQKKDLNKQLSHTAHYGTITDKTDKIIDEVVLTVFKNPHSFTTEDTVEISCHASSYIIQQIIQLYLSEGVRLATAGEFTQRAYLNGRMDLAQAEAIADLIASGSQAEHQIAMQQMRGGFSTKIKELREDFIRLAALLELELDFSEEDVEFANRDDLKRQLANLQVHIEELLTSFTLGNAIKNGIPIAIIGKPNAGKSTLLNNLLQEDKAIVSEIAGTTRDFIEDERTIRGIRFRFIDTAGLRETEDIIENLGIARTKQKIKEASLLLYLFDIEISDPTTLHEEIKAIEAYQIPYLLVANKADKVSAEKIKIYEGLDNFISISALESTNLDELEHRILEKTNLQALRGDQVIVSNLRHFQALQETQKALLKVGETLTLQLSTEFVASDIRSAIYHLGEITGEISNNDLLEHIFSKFCIGK